MSEPLNQSEQERIEKDGIEKFLDNSFWNKVLMVISVVFFCFAIVYIFDHWKDIFGEPFDHQYKIEKYKGGDIK